MKILQHLSAIVIITVITGLIFVSARQGYRSSANDPQVQIAYDLRDRLQQGKPLIFDDTVDLKTSLSVFKESFDNNGNPIQSTGFLHGEMPLVPKGVFKYAKSTGANWVTWQPQGGVRIALGIVAVHSGSVAYLAVGRSLKEAEQRISGMAIMVFTGWMMCISVVLVNWLVTYYNFKKQV